MKKRLYIIGIDSAPLWLIQKLSKRFGLRGFEEFFEQGTISDMQSTIPPVTAAAWPSIYSGLSPKEHGVMDFLHLDKNYTKQLIYYDVTQSKPFWDVLAKKGIKSLVITPPMVLARGKEKNVDLITGWPIEPNYSKPYLASLAKKFNFAGEPYFGTDFDKGKITLDQVTKLYVGSINARSHLAKHLINKNDYDLVFVCFTETDRIQHFALNRPDANKYIAPIYLAISDFVKWAVDRAKDEGAAVIVVSDHGGQPIKEEFMANSFLINRGFATLKGSISKEQAVFEQTISSKAKKYLMEKALKFPHRRKLYDAMPAAIKKAVVDVIEKDVEGKFDSSGTKISESDFDFANTKALAAISTGPMGMIWINDGRFSNPGVKRGEEKTVKEQVIRELSGLKTSDGKKLVVKLIDGKAHYKGASTFIAPDIIFELCDGYVVDFTMYSKGNIFKDPAITKMGDHSSKAVFGQIGIKQKGLKNKISVVDVFGLILGYFGKKNTK